MLLESFAKALLAGILPNVSISIPFLDEGTFAVEAGVNFLFEMGVNMISHLLCLVKHSGANQATNAHVAPAGSDIVLIEVDIQRAELLFLFFDCSDSLC